jgi:hypothetical protein
MNIRAMPFSGGSGRKPLMALVFLAFAAVMAYEVAGYVINDDVFGLAYTALIFVGGAFVIGMLNDWRNGLYFFLTWLLFEDFARKFLGNNMAIYFAKDFLVLVIYIAYFIAYRRREVQSFRPPFLVPLLMLVWFGGMQVFNPGSSHIMFGLLGFKLFFYYIPLMFVGYSLLENEEQLRKFFSVNMVLAVIIISLGVAQSIIGPSFLNPAHLADDIRDLSTLYRTAPISGVTVYRPTSVFVSAGRYSDFLIVAWMLVFGFSGYLLLRRRQGRALAFMCMALTFAGVALGASRGAFMWTAITVVVGSIAFIWGAPWRQREVIRVLRTLQRAVLGMALAMTVLFFTFPDALLGRLAIYSETLSPYSAASELTNRARDYPIRNFLGAFDYPRWPYGYGIGTTSLGVQYVSRFFHEKQSIGSVESGYGALVVEMGIGGLILWLIMTFSILFAAWRVVRKLKGSPWFPLAFIIMWYAFILLFPMTFAGIQAYEDFILNAYLWLLLGILFRLPSIALSSQFAAGAADLTATRRWVR